MKRKIALFCNVKQQDVIENSTADNLYAVPLNLEKEGLARAVCEHLGLESIEPQNEEWEEMINNIRNIKEETNIAIVGKYVQLQDSYLSVAESLRHGGFENNIKVNVGFVDSETINENNVKDILKEYKGIVVPGGFGNRGIEGKIETIKYARENNIPFLGICLGMQMAVVEFAKNVLKLEDVNSSEFKEIALNPVIHIMADQKDVHDKGGTMRLGAYPCVLKEATKARELYMTDQISERHRHRFEFNNEYKERIEAAGMICSGTSPDGRLVEIVEIPSNKFFIASQFHPEFKSRPNKPHPLFSGLIKAAKEN